MKKMFFGALVALGMLTACNGGPTAKLECDVDSLSYAIGMSQTQGLKDYLVMRMNVDTAYLDEFLKGFYDAAKAGKDPKKAAYYAGVQIGQQVSQGMVNSINQMIFGDDSTQTINEQALYAGFIAGVKADTSFMNLEEAGNYAQTNLEVVKARVSEAKFGENRTAGEEFIAAKAKEEGVQELGNGVYYKVLTAGNGEIAADTCRVKVSYEGRLIDGTVFDSNLDGEPTIFGASQVIPGFKAALTTMPVGSEWEIYIPQDQAYGSQDMGQIKPFSALIFKVKLIEIVK